MTSKLPVTVVIVDDEVGLCKSLQKLLESSGNVQVVAVGHTVDEAISLAEEYVPDVILLDLYFPEQGLMGIDAIKSIRANPDVTSRILVYTVSHSENTIFEALRAGANSYVWKGEDYQNILEAVVRTARGEAETSATIARRTLERIKHLLSKPVHERL